VLPGLMCYVLVQQGRLDAKKMNPLPVGQEVRLDERVVPVGAGRLELDGKELTAGGKKFEIVGRRAVIEDGVLTIDGEVQKDTKDTYGFMIRELLPVGLKGLVAAALLAALMSTVSGALNSIATLFSYDIVKRWRPRTSDRSLVRIGRLTTFVAMIIAILWSPFISRFESMYQGITALICYIAPPITVVFVVGVLWRRASSISAQVTLYMGSALGFVVFVLDWFKDYTHWNMRPMMATFYLFVVCLLIQILVSLRHPHEHTEDSERLVWSNPIDCLRSPGWPGLGNYKLLAFLLAAVMVGLYVIFA
jgi:SSS family solute:Na+ symporter